MAYGGKEPRRDQEPAKLHPVGVVHVEHVECRPADGGLSDQQRTVPCEVGAPALPAGIEESREPASLRVESGDVRAFVEVVVRGTTIRRPAGRPRLLGGPGHRYPTGWLHVGWRR